ncbi:sperm-associated antigen 16 protein-like [Lycodopsis pacificus]
MQAPSPQQHQTLCRCVGLSNETMSGNNKSREKDESVLGKSDDFQYEEVSQADDWRLTEGEEDLEAKVKAIRDRAEATSPRSITRQPQAVDDFLRNFLFQMGMMETLDCFQTEWTEMVQKGPVDTEPVGVVPGVYAQNQRLENELKDALREGEEYRLAASAGGETLARVRKDRDFHRLQHKRVVQEKNRVIEEIRKLKLQCDHYAPAAKRMSEKYQAVLKQTMLVTLERDKALGTVRQLSNTPPSAGMQVNRTGEPRVKGTTHPVIQPRPPTSAHSPGSQTRRKSGKANVC